MSRLAGKSSTSKQRRTPSSAADSPASGDSSARLSFDEGIPSPGSQGEDPHRPVDPAPPQGPSTRSSVARSAPIVETVDEQSEEEEEEEARSASDRDGDLSEASSAGESVPGISRPVESVDLVDLQGQDKCRQIYLGTLADGSKTRLCCGRSIVECRQHAKRRLTGKGRGLPRWYVQSRSGRGNSVHGLPGETNYTQAEYEALVAAELDEMRAVAHELEDESDEERGGVQGGVRRAPLVNFERGAHAFQTPPRMDRAPPREDFDEVPAEVAAQIAYLVRAELDKASAAGGSLRTGGGVPKAAAPLRAPPPEVLEIQDESSDGEERAPRHVAKAKRHGKAKQAAREWLGLLDPRGHRVIRLEGRGGTTLDSGWRLMKYFPDRDSARLWLSPKGGVSPSDSSSSTSSSDSEDSSSSSSSSSFLTPSSAKSRRSQRPKKKRTQKKKKKKKKEKKGDSSFRGTDSSTGDEKRIHGFEVSGVEIDKALAPAGLSSKDRVSLVETAVDVTSLPGMLSTTQAQVYDEVQGVTEAATSMLATLSGKRAQLHDTQWKTRRKNSLGSVTKETDLFALIEAVEESSIPAFDQQDSRIRQFLSQRLYDEDDIVDYLEQGLLPTLTRRTLVYFLELLNSIRRLYHKHNAWEGGPAKAMLDHHAKGLVSVRNFSIDYRTCILKGYVYLREAAAKKFFHPSMSEALWSRVAGLEAPHDVHPAPSGDPKCAHCRSKEVHSYLGLLPSRTHCPFSSLRINSTALKKVVRQSTELVATHPDVEAAKASIAEFVRLALATP